MMRVLLVDDNPDAVAVLAIALKRAGHEVHNAFDGPTALTTIRKLKPDFVFLDLGLPGMDGYEVARAVRTDPEFARTRILALTGRSQDHERAAATAAGFDQFLVKPVDFAFIESLLGARS